MPNITAQPSFALYTKTTKGHDLFNDMLIKIKWRYALTKYQVYHSCKGFLSSFCLSKNCNILAPFHHFHLAFLVSVMVAITDPSFM